MGSDSQSDRKAGRATAPLLLVLVAAVAGFAGCLGDGGEAKGQGETPAEVLDDGAAVPTVAAPVLADDGRDLRTELRAKDTVDAPTWHVGEAWDLMVLLGDGEELRYTTVMVEERADAFFLAAPDRAAAKEEAVWDLPIYGEVAKADLSLAMFGDGWDWIYRFPLADGLAWNGTVNLGDEVDVSFTARYAAAIATPAGERPGFHVTGLTPEGETLFDYDYVPELSWFAHFWAYDLETEEPDDFEFHAMMMDHRFGWTGEYYLIEAHPLVETFAAVILADPTDPYVEPAPHGTFTVSDDAAWLYGYAYAYAFGGAQETLLVGPDGTAYPHTGVGAPEGEEVRFYDAPATSGEWRYANAGAGAVAVGGLFLVELHEEVGTL